MNTYHDEKNWLHVIFGNVHGKFYMFAGNFCKNWNISAAFRFYMLYGKVSGKFLAAGKVLCK